MGFRWKHKFSTRFEGSFRTFTCHTALPIPKHSCNMLDTYWSYCWSTWARPPSVRDSTESGIIMEQAETQHFFASFAWSNKTKGMNWSGRIHQDSLRMQTHVYNRNICNIIMCIYIYSINVELCMLIVCYVPLHWSHLQVDVAFVLAPWTPSEKRIARLINFVDQGSLVHKMIWGYDVISVSLQIGYLSFDGLSTVYHLSSSINNCFPSN